MQVKPQINSVCPVLPVEVAKYSYTQMVYILPQAVTWVLDQAGCLFLLSICGESVAVSHAVQKMMTVSSQLVLNLGAILPNQLSGTKQKLITVKQSSRIVLCHNYKSQPLNLLDHHYLPLVICIILRICVNLHLFYILWFIQM